jgi:hypothetical protein
MNASLKLPILLAAVAVSGIAASIPVVSYSMVNGTTGLFNYQDTSYLPCPAANCTTSGAALSGGTGKLTDGVSPTLDWYQQGTNTSWVGWDSTQGLLNPTVTFNFGSTVTINNVTMWFSNSIGGGVALPAAVVIAGSSYGITPDSVNFAPRAVTISGLNITGTSTTVQFLQALPSSSWVMVGEVSFSSGAISTTPVPPSVILVLLGLACLGFYFGSRKLAGAA